MSKSSRRGLRLGYATVAASPAHSEAHSEAYSQTYATTSANLRRQLPIDADADSGAVRDAVADTDTDTDPDADIDMIDIDWQLRTRRPSGLREDYRLQQHLLQQQPRRDRPWNRDRDRNSGDSVLRRTASLPMFLISRAHSAAARRSVADIKGQHLTPQPIGSLKHPCASPLASNALSLRDTDPSTISVIDDATADCVLAAYSNDPTHLRRYKTVLLLDSTLERNIDSVFDAIRESFLSGEEEDDVRSFDGTRLVPIEAHSVPLERRAKRAVLNLCSRHLAYLSPNIGFFGTQISHLEICCNSLSILPPEIGHLRNLQFLSVSRNKLRTLPETIASCTKLAHIDAADNLISFLPRSISSLSMLHTLNLARNRLELLPQELGEARSLQRVDLTENTRLQWFPVEFFRLKGLVSLDVTGCTSLYGEDEYRQLTAKQSISDPNCPPTLKEFAARILRRHNAPVYKNLPSHLRAFLDPANFLTCSFCSGPIFSTANTTNTTNGYYFLRWRRIFREINIVFVAREVLCWRHWDTDEERIQRMFDVAGVTAPVVYSDSDLSVSISRAIVNRGGARNSLFSASLRQQVPQRRSSVILGGVAAPEETKKRLSLGLDDLVRGISDRLRSFSQRRRSLSNAASTNFNSLAGAAEPSASIDVRLRSQSNPVMHGLDDDHRLHTRQPSHLSTVTTATTASTSSAQLHRARSIFSLLTRTSLRRHGTDDNQKDGHERSDSHLDDDEESGNYDGDTNGCLQVPVYELMRVSAMLPPLVDRQQRVPNIPSFTATVTTHRPRVAQRVVGGV
ncbi:hypothetical protein HDU83_006296 [Entophlyctis luteolus]|nr:hypothetical protein HDU83_006296 [Entophlyctis luteolus]